MAALAASTRSACAEFSRAKCDDFGGVAVNQAILCVQSSLFERMFAAPLVQAPDGRGIWESKPFSSP